MSTANVAEKHISDYTPDSQNINIGSERGDYLLGKSLETVGAGRSVLADKNGVIIAGNKTLEKAGQIGIEKVIEVEVTGDTLVVVKRTDLDINSQAGAQMKVYDNTVAKHNYVEDLTVAAVVVQAYDLKPVELGLPDHDYKPVLNPEYSHKLVTDAEIKKADQELQNRMKGAAELLELTCPHCQESFSIRKP